MNLDARTLAEVMEATWPPASIIPAGPFLLRDGQGAGKRVSAATAEGPWTDADLLAAESTMRGTTGQSLFLIRQGDETLDIALAGRGYRVVDPVLAYAAPAELIAGEGAKHMTTFPHWPPLEIAKALWNDAGIGAARLAVMQRAKGAKCAILARTTDRPSGVTYVACHGHHAMLHALEVSSPFRRQGSAHNILRAAAGWALEQGADTLSLVVTEANAPARALYTSLGMEVVGHYHYRQN